MVVVTLEHEFIVVYKLGKTLVVVDVFSRLLDSSEALGVPYQTIDASLFSIELIWMQEVKNYFETNRCQKL